MFERFSSSYYLGELFIEPYDGERALMHRADHEQVNKQLYASGDGVERLDTPLVMKLDRGHFPVVGDESVPTGTLAIPRTLVGDRWTLPDRREVFLARAERAVELLRYAGYDSDGVSDRRDFDSDGGLDRRNFDDPSGDAA